MVEDGRWDGVEYGKSEVDAMVEKMDSLMVKEKQNEMMWEEAIKKLESERAKRVETIPNIIIELKGIKRDLERTRPGRLGGSEDKWDIVNELGHVIEQIEDAQATYNAKRRGLKCQ